MTAELPNDVAALQAEVAELRTTVARLTRGSTTRPAQSRRTPNGAAAIS